MSDWTDLKSSQLARAKWQASDDPELAGLGTLTIEFKSGSVYEYAEVEQTVFDELVTAESAGKYFHANIRGLYDHKQIEVEPPPAEAEAAPAAEAS